MCFPKTVYWSVRKAGVPCWEPGEPGFVQPTAEASTFCLGNQGLRARLVISLCPRYAGLKTQHV